MRTLLLAIFAAVAITAGEAQAEPEKTSVLNPLVSRQFDPDWIKKEKDCLSHTVEVEAGGEPFDGKLMVAWVVVKRADDDTTPFKIGSVCEQVNKKTLTKKAGKKKVVSQFQAAKKGRKIIVSSDSKLAAELVFVGRFIPQKPFIDIRFLYNPEISDPKRAVWFASLMCPLEIKRHVFCKKAVPLPRPRPIISFDVAKR